MNSTVKARTDTRIRADQRGQGGLKVHRPLHARHLGVEQRNRYLALLDRSFHDLAANPLTGRDCGYIPPATASTALADTLCFTVEVEPSRLKLSASSLSAWMWMPAYPNRETRGSAGVPK